MSRLRRHLITLVLLTSGGGLALIPSPGTPQLTEAYNEGVRLAQNPEGGYPVAAYAIYAVSDALKLEPQNGAVDAVVLGTPFERTRYEAFISVLGEDQITVQQARERADLPNGSVEFIVFAHGVNATDDKFLQNFSAATLQVGGQTLKPTATDRSDVSPSQYPRTVGEIGIRFVGTITYQFKLPTQAQNASGTLSFTDASGKAFRLPVNLSKYR